MTVYAQPPVGPIGYPIDTYDTQSGSPQIVLGTPGQPGYQTFPIAPNAFTFVSIDAHTLEATSSVTSFDDYDANPLYEKIDDVPAGSLNILATPGGSVDTALPFRAGEVSLGAEPIPYTVDSIFGSTVPQFSLIGPGQGDPPAAYQFTLPAASAPNYVPSVTGYLAQASTTNPAITGLYTFAAAEQIPYSMTPSDGFVVGCTQTAPVCGRANPTIPSPGFGVAVFDAYTLQPVASQGFAADAASLMDMAVFMSQYSNDVTKLTMVKSVGAPAPDETQWYNVSFQIAELGGSANVFNTYNPANQATGPNDYGFVAVPASYFMADPADTPSNTAVQVGPAGQLQMNGVLNRNTFWQYSPTPSPAPLPVFTSTLSQIAYQEAQAFPYSDVGGPYSDAEAYIASQIFCRDQQQGCTPPSDIRSQYWIQNLDWNDYTAPLQSTEFKDGLGFTSDQFDDLKGHLLNVEWPAVNRVSQLFGDEQLLQPFTSGVDGRTVNVQTIGQTIENDLPQPTESGFARILATIGDAVGIIGSFAGFFAIAEDDPGARPSQSNNPVASSTGALGGILANAFNLASLWVTDGSGNKLLAQIEEDASQIQSDVANDVAQAQDAFENIRQLVVSDYGKLLAVEDFANEELPWAGDLPQTAMNTLTVGANQLAWSTLVPAAFDGSCTSSLTSSPNIQQWNQVTEYTQGSSGIVPSGQRWSTSAPASVMGQVFAPLASDGTGTGGGMTPSVFWEDFYIPARMTILENTSNVAPVPTCPSKALRP
jgi:hypothetical protein